MGTHTLEQLQEMGILKQWTSDTYTLIKPNGDTQYWKSDSNGKYYPWIYTTQNN